MVAAVARATLPIKVLNEVRYPNVLVSFYYREAFGFLTYDPGWLIVDSGAFSAWSRGAQIDLEEYLRWALQIQDRHGPVHAVNLDVIPARPGVTSTPEQRRQAASQSLRNADRLREAGLRVMEVFHQDEPRDYLLRLVGRRRPEELLGLSPRNDVALPTKVGWHRRVLGVLTGVLGRDNLPPCHGLAAGSVRLVEAFPYYSIDASSWQASFIWGRDPDGAGQVTKKWYGRPGARIHASREWHAHALPTRRNLERLLRVEGELTRMWEQRGVVWPVM